MVIENNINTAQEKEIALAFEHIFNYFFRERNYEMLATFLHPKATSYGLFNLEKIIETNDILILLKNDIDIFNNKNEFDILHYKVVSLSPSFGYVSALFTTEELQKHKSSLVVAVTIILTKVNNQWLIQHIHKSEEKIACKHSVESPLKSEIAKLDVHELSNLAIDLKHELKRLELISTTDSLTGLYNRYKFNEDIKNEVEKAKKGQPLSIIMGDIDFFKQVNDRFGHLIGDELLKIYSKIMKANIPEHSSIYRWGGEEFIIILPLTTLDEAIMLAEKIRTAVNDAKNTYNHHMTISFGVVEHNYGNDVEALLSRADLALYKAKRNGRNQVRTLDI